MQSVMEHDIMGEGGGGGGGESSLTSPCLATSERFLVLVSVYTYLVLLEVQLESLLLKERDVL